MEAIKPQTIFPNINKEDFVRSHTQIIDNPRDNDLKRRQTLWSFQNKNRGVIGKFKGSDSEVSSYEGVDEHKTEEGTLKSNKRFSFPRLKQKVKEVCAGGGTVQSEDTTVVKREYSSALRIGNSLYEQLRIKQKLDNKDSYSKHRNSLKAINKFPDVSNSLSKLSYLKATKNVVHYGGGFFGRSNHPERKYTDFQRSATMISPTESNLVRDEKQFEKKVNYASLGEIDQDIIKMKHRRQDHEKGDILTICSHEISGPGKISSVNRAVHSTQKRKPEKENDNISKKSKGDLIEKEILSEKFSISFDKHSSDDNGQTSRKSDNDEDHRRIQEWQRDIDSMVANHALNSKQNKRESASKLQRGSGSIKPNKSGRLEFHDDKSESDISLDMPEDQFGPSSHRPFGGTTRQLNAAYSVNPYRWTSRSSLTENDRTWVEKAMEKTELIDSTIYNDFARKKSKSSIKNSDQFGREKSQLTSKPP